MHNRDHFINKYSASNLWIQKAAPINFNVIKQTRGKKKKSSRVGFPRDEKRHATR